MEAHRRLSAFRLFVVAGVVAMAVASVYRVPVELSRLVFEPPGHRAAMDLMYRHAEVEGWFAGRPLYGVMESADYPPASYLILAPLLLWTTPEVARVVWALASLFALAWLSRLCVRATAPRNNIERAFAALLPFAGYATAATLRLGQMGMLLLPLLAAATLQLSDSPRSWMRDGRASLLLVAALVKPTIAPPFLWIAVFLGGWRPAVMIAGTYAALTLVSASFQEASVFELFRGWLGQDATIDFATAHGNVYSWMHALGLERGYVAVSVGILLLLGAWTWRHRHADLWTLLAVAALTARMWAYHHHYDDVLMLFPIIALWRMVVSNRDEASGEVTGMALLALLWAFSVSPAQWLDAPAPWGELFKGAKTITWILTLFFLGARSTPQSSSSAGLPGSSNPAVTA